MVTVEHGQLRQALIAGRGKEAEAGTDLARQVRDALMRLYDLPYLQGHSLIKRLYGQSSDRPGAEVAMGHLRTKTAADGVTVIERAAQNAVPRGRRLRPVRRRPGPGGVRFRPSIQTAGEAVR